MNDNKIMIISEKETFIIRILMKKLSDAGLNAVFVPSSIERIDSEWKDISLVTFYMEKDEYISDEIRTFVTDKMKENDVKAIIIGEMSDAESVAKKFPRDAIYKIMPRPLDYDDYIGSVSLYNLEAESGALKKSILIVDDDPNYMSLVHEWLKDTYKVSMATSGLRAIKWLGMENKVDLILLDYEMPVTSGPQVLEMLRSDEATRYIPVIFLTGRDDKESVTSVLSLKPEGYFLKTIDKEELLHKLMLFFMKKEV